MHTNWKQKKRIPQLKNDNSFPLAINEHNIMKSYILDYYKELRRIKKMSFWNLQFHLQSNLLTRLFFECNKKCFNVEVLYI